MEVETYPFLTRATLPMAWASSGSGDTATSISFTYFQAVEQSNSDNETMEGAPLWLVRSPILKVRVRRSCVMREIT